MMRLLRHLPRTVVTGVVALLLTIFIAVPIGTVLLESFVISGPMPPLRLKAVTMEAVAELPPNERDSALQRWTETATEAERVGATTIAFDLAGVAIPWDRNAAYSEQTKGIQAALNALPPSEREAIESNFAIAHVMLHKRTALAFKVKDQIGKQAFDTLRNGTEDRWGLDHYLEPQDSYLRTAAVNSMVLAAFSVVFTVPLAFALAYGINCGGVPWPSAMRVTFLMPLVAPPILIATATVMLFGRRGLVTHTLYWTRVLVSSTPMRPISTASLASFWRRCCPSYQPR